uniref:Progestin and adipoQ receptor family member VII, b n=1 Tax=Neogobius melanostomus TaxID=47308 RepID=A0A8C6SNE5_9GOBI
TLGLSAPRKVQHGDGGDGADWSPVHQCATAPSDPSAAGVSLPHSSLHVKLADVPEVFRERYVLSGYRQTDHSWRYYFLTLFQRHNESINVWTHLLTALIILVKCQEISQTVDFLRDPHAQPLFIILLTTFITLSFSALAHLLSAKSELSFFTFYFLDYFGVAVYQYGCAVAHYYYVIEEEWHSRVRGFYLPTAAFLSWLTCFGCCYGRYASLDMPKFANKLFQLVPCSLAYCLDTSPVVHRIYKCYQTGCSDPAVSYHFYILILFVVSAYFFSFPHPESLFTGRCDFIGQGHQIFHVLMAACALMQIAALRMDFSERRPLYERLHGDLAHDAVALFIFTTCCSALTVFYVRKRVKASLCTKQD